MEPERARTIAALRAPVASLVGGALAFVGTFLPWFTARVSAQRGVLLGQDVPVLPATASRTGAADWTGKVALAAGLVIVAAGLAALLARTVSSRWTWYAMAIVGGIVALGSGVIALGRTEAVISIEFARQELLSGLGSGIMVRGVSSETGASFGPYVSIGGGAVAAVAGLIGLRRSGARHAAHRR